MPPDRFRLDELAGSAGTGGDEPSPEQTGLLATARDLEWLAAGNDVGPTVGFEDRVMAAIAAEPAPRPLAAAARAAQRGRLAGILTALGDLWRVAWTGGHPLAVRAPAMALVVLLLAASIGLGGLGAAAALGILEPREPVPVLTLSPAVSTPSSEATPGPTSSPTASPSPSPSPSAEPSESPEASESPEPSESPEASESPESAETDAPASTPRPTPRPTASPEVENTPRPTRTPHPTETPEPTRTPTPTPAPEE